MVLHREEVLSELTLSLVSAVVCLLIVLVGNVLALLYGKHLAMTDLSSVSGVLFCSLTSTLLCCMMFTMRTPRAPNDIKEEKRLRSTKFWAGRTKAISSFPSWELLLSVSLCSYTAQLRVHIALPSRMQLQHESLHCIFKRQFKTYVLT